MAEIIYVNMLKELKMEFELIEAGEIRFGPRFFNLKINEQQLNNRIFGDEIYQSSEDRYLVLQEWLTTEYTKGPITRPFIIDRRKLMFTTISDGKKGFASKFEIVDGIFTYSQINKGLGITKMFECTLNQLNYTSIEML